MSSADTVEFLTDEERLLVLTLVTRAWVDIRTDPKMDHASKECESILRKLQGCDKRVSVERMR